MNYQSISTIFFVSTDKELLDIPLIHNFLTEQSYWAKGRTLEMVKKSIKNSLCFGVYDKSDNQIGFARVVTDYAIFGWLMDVFVLEEFRSRGISKMLMKAITAHPDLNDLKRMGLGTDDAHGLYNQYGFAELKKPENMMELIREQH
ncbi:GNAT family N-acetyltransferase [Sunxiuqinia sp. A32]|uniref:GNAT family N-acetyltransferase n=1 Tax=Sunxiuqinia sp. A32 TaxID=3461496 RepID=UPI00404580B7